MFKATPLPKRAEQEQFFVSHNHNDEPVYPSPIRGVILDYGDVISHPMDPTVIAAMARVLRLPEERFRQIYDSFRLDYDRGTLSPDEYWVCVARAAGAELSAEQIAELRRADVAMWSRLNESILRWAGQLRAGGRKTAILSNMHHDMVQHIRQNGMWTKNFDCVIFSSPLKMAKPDAAIFKHCLNCLQLQAKETLFIDDRERNVRAAEAQGIHGIVAPTTAALRVQLEAIGFSPLPE